MAVKNPDDYLKRELSPELYERYQEGLLGRKRKNFCDDCIAVSKKRAGGEFYPRCRRGTDEWAAALAQGLSPEAAKIVWATEDPVEWAKQELGWNARFYQSIMLRCTSSKQAMRLGRRTGKSASLAVRALHMAATKPGAKENDQYIVLVIAPYENQLHKLFDYMRNLLQRAKSIRIIDDKRDPQILSFANNSIIKGFTSGSKAGARSAKIRGEDGHCVVAGTRINISEFASIPVERLTLQNKVFGGDHTGLYTGEIEGLAVTKDKDTISIVTPLTYMRCTPDHPLFDGKKDVPAEHAEKAIVSLAHQELTYSREVMIARLAGYCMGDGWICAKSDLSAASAGFSGQEEDLEQVAADLYLLGDSYHIPTTRETENPVLGIKGITSQFSSSWAYNFLKDYIPAGEKVYHQLLVPSCIKNGKDYVKAAYLSGLMSAEGTGLPPVKGYPHRRKGPWFGMLSSKKEWLVNWLSEIKQLFADLGIETGKLNIKQKVWKEERWMGGFTVSAKPVNLDRFVHAVGFCYNVQKRISCNTWKLYRHYCTLRETVAWQKNREVRKHTGSQRSIARMLGIPRDTVRYHQRLYHPLYSEEKLLNPEELVEFYRWQGCYLRLPITTHARKNTGKHTVYNLQSSAANRFMAEGMMTHNCIIIDELELIRDEDLDTILAIFASHADCRLYYSSTPSGLPSKFKSACEDYKQRFKEFWFAAHESPEYSDEADETFKTQMDRIKYEHEILATFGEAEGAIFSPEATRKCLKNYQLGQPLMPDEFAIIGVDSNSKSTGTHAIVLAAKLTGGSTHFRVIDIEVIMGGEQHNKKSVQRLIELYHKWNPVLLCLDKGYADDHIERLIEYSLHHPEYNLRDSLKYYDLGSYYKMLDPMTGTEIQKPYKPLMVGIAQRYIQQGHFTAPKSEDKPNGLIDQMLKFHVKSMSPAGQPKYSQGNEHTLTAMMLGIMGWVIEVTGFDPVTPATDIVNPAFAKVPDGLVMPVPSSSRALAKGKSGRSMDDEPGGRPRRISRFDLKNRSNTKNPMKRKTF